MYKKFGRNRDSNRLHVGHLTAVPPHMCIMQAANNSTNDSILLVMGNFRKSRKASNHWPENFPFQKIFRPKNTESNIFLLIFWQKTKLKIVLNF